MKLLRVGEFGKEKPAVMLSDTKVVDVSAHVTDYNGAFFESGVAGPHRNGELCIPPITDDPLEAINVRLIRRSHR